MANWIIWSRVNLAAPKNALPLTDFGFARVGDKGAHTWQCEVSCDGQPVDLTGYTARGFFIRPDNYSVEVPGSVSGCSAICTLPAACYEAAGRLIGCLKIINEGTGDSVTVAAGFMNVEPATTDSYVDPEHVIPSLAELLAQLDACREATQAAQEAAQALQVASVEEAAEIISAYGEDEDMIFEMEFDNRGHGEGRYTSAETTETIMGAYFAGKHVVLHFPEALDFGESAVGECWASITGANADEGKLYCNTVLNGQALTEITLGTEYITIDILAG